MWAILSGVEVVTRLVQLGAGGSSWSAWWSLVVGGGMLVLLSHPTNRVRRNGPVTTFPVNAHPADASCYYSAGHDTVTVVGGGQLRRS
jgi:hypothetical protein